MEKNKSENKKEKLTGFKERDIAEPLWGYYDEKPDMKSDDIPFGWYRDYYTVNETLFYQGLLDYSKIGVKNIRKNINDIFEQKEVDFSLLGQGVFLPKLGIAREYLLERNILIKKDDSYFIPENKKEEFKKSKRKPFTDVFEIKIKD